MDLSGSKCRDENRELGFQESISAIYLWHSLKQVIYTSWCFRLHLVKMGGGPTASLARLTSNVLPVMLRQDAV